MSDTSKIRSVTNLRNWAKWIVAACQEELDHIGTPDYDSDHAGPEVEAEHFLENHLGLFVAEIKNF